MHRNWIYQLILTGGLVASLAHAQQSCVDGIRIDGSITDPTGAVIPGAQVRASNGEIATTDTAGYYVLPCVQATSTTLTAQAGGFASGTVPVRARKGGIVHMNLKLALASVETEVQVGADVPGIDSDSGAGTTVLNTQQVQQLPDDPDDLLRELQILASSGEGDPTTATIGVDGFQNSSVLPPKSSIASIRINPDSFAPEFQWHRGHIEIITKPGADKFHGALFFTDSNSIFNSTDPFSLTSTPAGRRRYGFELTGPIVRQKLDFSLALERRDIDEFSIVTARTLGPDNSLGPNGNGVPLQQTVAAPQRLWIGSGRGDWQVNQKDIATVSYSGNVNDQGNQGVGGLVLQEAGYSSDVSEYDLRFSNDFTINANTLHETRIGYSWKRTRQLPNSTMPNLQVAGYFTGGGATSQNLNDRERDLEVDDDIIATRGKHELTFGFQSITSFVHDYDPNTFNGAYVFGGGSAPPLDENNDPSGPTTTITGLDQYRRALLNLPGGSPTNYEVTTGNPIVPLTQAQLSWYGQDTMKVLPRLSVTFGLRYQLEINPDSFPNLRPRLGFVWSPDKKAKWTIGMHAGLFTIWDTPANVTEVERLNGSRQLQNTVYSPSYNNPLVPVPGSIQVGTRNQFSRSFGQTPDFQFGANVAHELPHHWTAQLDYSFGAQWEAFRIININAPMVPSSMGVPPDPTAALLAPRPLVPNENIMQYQNYGHYRGSVYVASVKQHSYKRFNLDASYWYLDFIGDSRTPQSSYTDSGEASRPNWMRRGGVSVLGMLQLPFKVEFDTQFSALPGLPYDITTGTDANGDGTFNDRPSYASASGSGVYNTPYGLMTVNTINGNVPNNSGTMPWVIHLDPNIRRAFVLNPTNKDHPLTIMFNARGSNVLNHTNVTAVNTVLSSGTVGQPNAAEPARRVELGVRFEF